MGKKKQKRCPQRYGQKKSGMIGVGHRRNNDAMLLNRIQNRRLLVWCIALAGMGTCLVLFPVNAFCDDATNAPQAAVAEEVNKSGENDRDAAYSEVELLTEAMLQIRRNYVEEKTYKQIVRGALQGMLQALDQHSSFLDSEAFKDIQDETSGKYSGIGIHIGLKDGILTVIAPIEDTPAFRAGLQSGDRIIQINTEKTAGMELKDAVKRLRGAKGTEVTVSVVSPNEDKPREIKIVRDDIEVSSVKGAKIERDGVGYVRITQFSTPTANLLQEALDKLTAQGMNALVLDLRGNPGGLLTSAVEVAQKFLKRGQLIVTTKGREGVFDKVESKALGDHHYTDFPMAILINGGSASASEIVAGALHDQKRAVLVGDTTYGKGSVQTIIQLRSDKQSALRLTTALYYTPAGKQINDKGIEPDILVPVGPEEWRKMVMKRIQMENPQQYNDEQKKPYNDVVDRQMERAIDLLQAIKIFK
jgi:carboxyl-terminal processing protease